MSYSVFRAKQHKRNAPYSNGFSIMAFILFMLSFCGYVLNVSELC